MLAHPVATSKVNTEAFNAGITLSYLMHKKQSLEDQFIELTNQN